MRFAQDVTIEDLHVILDYPTRRFEELMVYIWTTYH